MDGNPEFEDVAEDSPDEYALARAADDEYCYLTTTGRVSGQPHEIEIWFAMIPERRVLYLLSGRRDRSDWVKNLKKEPRVVVRLSGYTINGTARIIEGESEDPTARDMLVAKYEREPGSLSDWRESSLPVAVSLA